MELQVNLELPGFDEALAHLLPQGIVLHRLQLTAQRLEAEGRAPVLGRLTLTAKVHVGSGRLTLSAFDVRGAGLMNSMVLSQLQKKLRTLDFRSANLRLWGDCDGSFAYLSWTG